MEIPMLLSELKEKWYSFAVHPQNAFGDFFGEKNASMEKWMTGETIPAGEEKLQVLFFLEQYGKKTEELRNTAELVRQLCELIAFGIITSEEIREKLDYSERNHLANRLVGKGIEIPSGKQGTARKIIAENEKFLTAKKTALSKATQPANRRLFSGNWEACLADLATTTDVSFLAPLIGVQPIAVKEWLNGTYKPRGKNYFKLICVLTRLGYEVEEYAKLSTSLQKLADLIGFEILSPKEVNTELGYNEEKALYRLLNFEINLSDEKKSKVESLIAEWHELAQVKILELNFPQYAFQPIRKTLDAMPEILRKELPASTEVIPRVEIPAVVNEKPATPVVKTRLEMEQEKTGDELLALLPKGELTRITAHQIDALLPLVELLASDRTTAEEREALREMVQAKNGLFRLSNAATLLCGEKIREQKK